ncbi:MAG: hypothetical protein KAI73_02510 [Rhodospirillaceae bacterium]|nr:hypothetical protein [Rhodospirillaceae bacterium]
MLAAVARLTAPAAPRRPVVATDAAGLYRYYRATLRGCLGDVAGALPGERQVVLVARAARVVGVALAAGVDPQAGLAALRMIALQHRPDDERDIDRGLNWALENVDEPQYPKEKTR